MRSLNQHVENPQLRSYVSKEIAERMVRQSKLTENNLASVAFIQRSDGRWVVYVINHPEPMEVVSFGFVAWR